MKKKDSGDKVIGSDYKEYFMRVSKSRINKAKRLLLMDDEKIEAMVRGRCKEKATKTKGRHSIFSLKSDKGGSTLFDYLIVTNKRVIFWVRGVFNSSSDAFEISDIKSVEQQRGIMWGSIVLNIYGKTEHFYEIDIRQSKMIRDLIRKKISHSINQHSGNIVMSQEVDPVSQIEKLAGLHEKGLITDDEFMKKKKELLDKI